MHMKWVYATPKIKDFKMSNTAVLQSTCNMIMLDGLTSVQ